MKTILMGKPTQMALGKNPWTTEAVLIDLVTDGGCMPADFNYCMAFITTPNHPRLG
jgi:hypothetical protein